MSVARNQLITSLSPLIPLEIVEHLVDEYQEIKKNFAFGKFRPSELSGGRFSECMIRLIDHLNSNSYTPFGTQLKNIDSVFNTAKNNTSLDDSMRFYILPLCRMLLDIRNRRDVAHVGGSVNPNHSDAIFVCHCADWIMTEIVRMHFLCDIITAKKIVDSINESQIPLIADVDGFLRVQNTSLDNRKKVLAILYHKHPSKVRDDDLVKWLKYSNPSTFKKSILGRLDDEALIHYEKGLCSLLPKGIMYTQKNIPLEIVL